MKSEIHIIILQILRGYQSGCVQRCMVWMKSLKQLAFINQRLCAWLRVVTAEFGRALASDIVAFVFDVSTRISTTTPFSVGEGGRHESCNNKT